MRRDLIIVLVLDIAHDGFNQIFQADEAIGAAIFIDHQRHLDAVRLHLRHQIGRRHRGRHEQERASDSGIFQIGIKIDLAQIKTRSLRGLCRLATALLDRGLRARARLRGEVSSLRARSIR